MYRATKYSHDDVSHLNIHIANDLHNVIVDRAIVVVTKILLRISVKMEIKGEKKSRLKTLKCIYIKCIGQ